MSGGPDGPEVRIMKAGGARMVTVTVTLTMHEAKWPRALTTLRWCLLISRQCLKSVNGGAAKRLKGMITEYNWIAVCSKTNLVLYEVTDYVI